MDVTAHLITLTASDFDRIEKVLLSDAISYFLCTVVERVTVSETLLHKPGFSYRMVHVIFNGKCNNLGAGFFQKL